MTQQNNPTHAEPELDEILLRLEYSQVYTTEVTTQKKHERFLELKDKAKAELLAYFTARERRAERRGESSQLKLMLHWAKLHNKQDVIDYAEHVLGSLKQFPDQPLARETLAALKVKKGES